MISFIDEHRSVLGVDRKRLGKGGLDPFNGALYVFRSKRADRVRIVWWDGSGVCLYSKTLEENSFCWPGISRKPTRRMRR